MTSKKLLLALSALFAASAFAQASLGTVTHVEGVVTATQGSPASASPPVRPSRTGCGS